jgi:hypothetical protein
MSESELARRFNVDLMIFAQRFGSFGGRCITRRHECGQRQRLGRRKKERLSRLRDTGDDNETVALREEEKEGEGEEGYAGLDKAIIASNKGASYYYYYCYQGCCCCLLILSSVTICVRMFTTPYNSCIPPARSEIAFAKLL